MRVDGCKTAAGERVDAIGIGADFAKFLLHVVPASPAGEGRAPLAGETREISLAAKDVLVGGKVSLRDAWKFAQGELSTARDEYVPLRTLWGALLRGAMQSPKDKIPESSIATVKSVLDAIAPFADLLDAEYPSADHPCEAAGTQDADVICVRQRNLGVLLAPVLAEANAQNQPRPDGALSPPEQKTGIYHDTLNLTTWLDEWVRAAMLWNEAPEFLAKVIETEWEQANRVMGYSSRAGLTQQSWFDMYLTPIVGRAMVMAPSATFSDWFVGIQVFGYANPVNEPMWFNGKRDDARRLLALELAVIPTKSGFGPSQRFSGMSGSRTPPVMFGAALQLIPYVTVSAGGIWLTEHKTGVVGESGHATVRPYLSLAVQANVPGIIRHAVVPAASTLVEGGKK